MMALKKGLYALIFFLSTTFLSQAFEIDEGSMQGYFTNYEINEILNQFTKKHPKASVETIGHSFYNRSIQLLRIKNEHRPKVLIVGGHHSRELISISQVLFLAQYLLELPVVDKDVWLIPVINVDGLATISEWFAQTGIIVEIRKNVRPSPCLLRDAGVDLNRNYGFMWGFDNFGSSPRPCDPQFRGDESFSELETQAIKNLIETTNFSMVLSYHSYGDFYIRPTGYQKNSLEDFPKIHQILYKELDQSLPPGIKFGSVQQLIKYSANGSFMDYLYSKGIFNIEVEMGPKDLKSFHPGQKKIKEVLFNHFEPFKLLFSFVSARVRLDVMCFDMFIQVNVINKGLSRSESIQLVVKSENSIEDFKVLSGQVGYTQGSDLVFHLPKLDVLDSEKLEILVISNAEFFLFSIDLLHKNEIQDSYKGKLLKSGHSDSTLILIISLMISSTIALAIFLLLT